MASRRRFEHTVVGACILVAGCAGETAGDDAGSGGALSTGGADATSTGGTASTGGASSGGQPTGGNSAGGGVAGGGMPNGGAGGGETGGAGMGGAGTGGTVTGDAAGGVSAGGTGGSDGYPLGNPPVPSTGCSRSPSLSSGTHHLTSAGLEREFILSLPDNYDSDTPYRLVFGMHWMGGSAEDVRGWSEWYGLETLDTEHTTIWVAPQGYTDSWPWRGSDDRDHVFFDELYEALTSDLCVDTSRVFSIGFSFGAMFTNALAQNHQDVLRGVVVYAAADYNIYFPENTGKPLAYLGVHGMSDPTCPVESGRKSKDRFVANNQCAVPGSVPEAKAGGSYVTYDYECPSNYPVRWTTFDGKHTYPPNNDGDWVFGQTWEFISQF